MPYNSSRHHRHSVRLPKYVYSQDGAYFVTLCAQHKKPVFGVLEQAAIRLNLYGQIVADEWLKTPQIRPDVMLDEWIVMPDHFHAIVWIQNSPPLSPILPPSVGAHGCAPVPITPTISSPSIGAHGCAPILITPISAAPLRRPKSLSSLIAQYKATVTRRINGHRHAAGLSPVKVWQRSFFERVIRDENELQAIRQYIIENPHHWEKL